MIKYYVGFIIKTVMNNAFHLTAILLIFSIGLLPAQEITKPDIFTFGSSLEEMKKKIEPFCDEVVVRLNEEQQLPTATESQSQLDVAGFMFAGKKRKVELIFANDQLDLIWILTEHDEEKSFIESYKELYGDPTHELDEVTFFLEHGVAVRNKPHEILFISERLKEPYRQWLTGAVSK